MNIVTLTFCVIVLTTCNHQTQALSSVFFSNINDKSLVQGLCASSVAIHGYKCEEHEVRIMVTQNYRLYTKLHSNCCLLIYALIRVIFRS